MVYPIESPSVYSDRIEFINYEKRYWKQILLQTNNYEFSEGWILVDARCQIPDAR